MLKESEKQHAKVKGKGYWLKYKAETNLKLMTKIKICSLGFFIFFLNLTSLFDKY